MPKKKRILYVMHVDWDWIKQRPHFIAERLSEHHDVLVIYSVSWRRRNLTKNKRNHARVWPFFRLPLSGRVEIVSRANILLLKLYFHLIFRLFRPELIWMSSPEMYPYLPYVKDAAMIYDCMDDILEFPVNAPRREKLAKMERALIQASSKVFCSSNSLKMRLEKRAECEDKCSIIYNALDIASLQRQCRVMPERRAGVRIIGYVGTISSWLDFEGLEKLVAALDDVEVHLVGPMDHVNAGWLGKGRIRFLGAINHDELPEVVQSFDALIMPFCVTELIRSVDPVKLYEYVYFDRPIVSVKYDGLEHFSEFVDFYQDHNQLIEIVREYLSNGFRKKYSEEQRVKFISANDWDERVRQIERLLP